MWCWALEIWYACCIDLASNYRAMVHKHFLNALIVAARFHVIRLVNHHFLNCWRDLDAQGVSVNAGGALPVENIHQFPGILIEIHL
jgi:transposase